MQDEDEQEAIEIPAPVQPPQYVVPSPVEVEPEREEDSVEDLSDLSQVTKEDIMGKRDGNSQPDDMSDLTSLDEQDMADILEVDEEDIMGEAPEPPDQPERGTHIVRRFKRTARRYQPPPASMGGIR